MIFLSSPFRTSRTHKKSQLYLNGSSTGTFLSLADFLKRLVDSKPYLDLPSKDLFPTILQLRTRYCSLNEYRYKLNQCESSLQTVSLSLSHWYPGPGVVLDCNDY